MHLDEFAVRVVATLLVERVLGGAGAHNRVCGFAEDRANAAGGDDDGVGGKGADFHAAEGHRADAAAAAFAVQHCGENLPVLVFLYFAFGFVTTNLLVERVEKLLAGSGSGERGAVVERSTEAAEIEQTFRRAVKGNA